MGSRTRSSFFSKRDDGSGCFFDEKRVGVVKIRLQNVKEVRVKDRL